MGVVNETVPYTNVVYGYRITLLTNLKVPEFIYPTNTTVITNLETVPITITNQAVDLDTPALPLSYALVSGPTGLTLTNNVIYWTPTMAQAPSTNLVQVSVSNGAFSVTNTFTIIDEESNLPPVLPEIPFQVIFPPATLVVTNTAINPNYPAYPLTYTLTTTLPVAATNQAVISTNGIITWTPANAQEEGFYLFTTVVTDTNPWAVNAQSLTATNSFYVLVVPELLPGQPLTNNYFTNVGSGEVFWFYVPVPTNAVYATNTLLYSSLPINLWFSTNLPPAATNSLATVLLNNSTYGVSVLSTNLATAPTNIVQGGYYLLGVQNTNTQPVSGELEIAFGFASEFTLSLPTIPDQIITAGDTLTVADGATDNNPSAVLNYTLVSAPSGTTIDSSGNITWPSTSVTAPTSVVITTSVTDSNSGETAQNSFTVLVLPGLSNSVPVTNTIPANSITWFTVKVPANADLASNILLFATGPLNLWYSTNVPPSTTKATDFELLANQTSGTAVMHTNTLPALVPGGRYELGVQNPNNYAVTYAEVVRFHLLPLPVFNIFSVTETNFVGSNGMIITWYAPTNDQFHLQWTDDLTVRHWSNFNGVISFTSFVGATNSLFRYVDDGSQSGSFGPMRYYRLLLLTSPTNAAPYFLTQPAAFYYVTPGLPFLYTNGAADWDIPAQTLTYALTNSAGATNVAINATTGVITWTPTLAQAGLTNVIITSVTDNGVPAKSVTNLFTVIVTTNTAPMFSSVSLGAKGLTFQWTAAPYEQYQIRWTTNLAPANWQTYPNVITSTNTSYSFVDTNLPLLLMKFYQLIFLP
jgi:hypothetical protein